MGQYSIKIEKSAQKELQAHFKSGDRAIIKRIEEIFKELAIHPETGIGKPELLKYQLTGIWSRRLSLEHRRIYQITENTIVVYSAKGHYI